MARHGRNGQLPERQARFVKEYLIDLNATQAAIRAGFSRKTARRQGSRLLTKVHIQSAIEKLKIPIEEKLELRAEDNLEQIRRGSQFDMRTLFDKKGNLRPIQSLSAEEASAIEGFEVVQRNITSGDDKVDTIIKVKLVKRSEYVKMAGLHFEQFTEKVKVDASDAFLAELAEGRKRVAACR